MEEVIIIGASGHAAEIQEYILAANAAEAEPVYRIKGFLDDDPEAFKKYRFQAPYLGGIQAHQVDRTGGYVIGIANLAFRQVIVERFLDRGAKFRTLIHPWAWVSASAEIGTGTILGPNVTLGPNVRVGRFNLLNSRASLGHDTSLGDFNFISPNVSLSGGTLVGNGNLFGINSVTKPGISIGNQNKIEAGMVVDRSIGDGAVVFYRHKERIIARPKE